MSSAEADRFIEKHRQWKPILITLRRLAKKAGLEETIKWGSPVYMKDGKNILGLGAFKSYAGIWFFQGALLEDKAGVLINAQEGRTKAQRQWRFSDISEINETLISAYISEAIENQKQEREIKPARKKPLVLPDILKSALREDIALNDAFESLSLSCRREYAGYIGEAKKEETKIRRLEKVLPMIRERTGLNDRYRPS